MTDLGARLHEHLPSASNRPSDLGILTSNGASNEYLNHVLNEVAPRPRTSPCEALIKSSVDNSAYQCTWHHRLCTSSGAHK